MFMPLADCEKAVWIRSPLISASWLAMVVFDKLLWPFAVNIPIKIKRAMNHIMGAKGKSSKPAYRCFFEEIGMAAAFMNSKIKRIFATSNQ